MFASIGYGGMTATKAVNRVRDEVIRHKGTTQKTALDKLNEQAEKRAAQKVTKAVQGVLVEGLDNCLIKFSRCCTPVPGDDIVGFITRGYGVSIHRTDCANYQKNLLSGDGRWLTVSWADDITDTYVTTLKMTARERSGLVMDIATVLSSLNAKFRTLNARDVGMGKSTATITLEVKDLQELKTIINKLSAISGVSEVVRVNG